MTTFGRCQGENKPTEALLFVERAKGRVLLDVLRNSGPVDISQAMSHQEKEEEKLLYRQIVTLNRQIRQECERENPNKTLLGNLQAQLRAARLKYESFQDTLSASHADLRVWRSQPTPTVCFDHIKSLVSDHKTAFLEYVVAGEKVYLFVLTGKDGADGPELKVYPISITEKDLALRANSFRQMLAARDPDYAASAGQLYDLFIRPAEEQLRETTTLCIIPDGPLWELPFQVLQTRVKRYLLEDHALYYAPSLSVLREMRTRRNSPRPGPATLLAMGNPLPGTETIARLKAVTRDDLLAPLPEAEAEVKTLGQMFGSDRSKIFTGPQASEKIFKAEAGAYKFLHIATHGEIDDQNPLYSRLIMSKTDDDPETDGLLEAGEIMQMNLHADLAVLSACQTARGRVGAGEGVIGLAWAFFVAGTPTTVVSQWNVDSASTAQMMVNFYGLLQRQGAEERRGMTKAEALRSAALALLKDQRYVDPYFWAAFIMVGNGQ